MLEAIRRRSRGLLAWILVLAIIVPFAFWGIQNYFKIGKERPVAVVGDVAIYQRDIQRYYEETLAHLLPLSDEQHLKRLALAQLIRNQLLLQEAKRQGVTVSEEEAVQLLKQLPEFQRDGRFDLAQFKAFLAARGMTEESLLHRLQQALLVEKLQAGIRDSSLVTRSELERFYALQNEERKLHYLTLPEALVGEVELPEEELIAYYQEHLDRFVVPEQVQIEYIRLSPELLAERVEISEEPLREAYRAQIDRFTEPEKRRVRHILIAVPKSADEEVRKRARQKAEALLERLKAGEPFSDLAKRFSDDPLSRERGGDLGWIGPGDVDPSLYEAIRTLKPGQVKLVVSPFGFHLVEVTQIRPKRVKPFAEVKAILLKELQREEAERRFYKMAEEIANLAYENPGTLEPIAKRFDLKIEVSPFFSRERGEGIAAEPKVREAAFSEAVLAGENSEPIELPNGQLVVLRLKARRPARQRPFEEVREEILTELRLAKKAQKLQEQAEALLASGKELPQLAAELGVELKEAALRRGRPFEGDLGATAKLFRAHEKRPFSLQLADGRLLLVEVVAIERPDLKELEEEERLRWLADLRRLYGQIELGGFVEQLKEEAEVKILRDLQ